MSNKPAARWLDETCAAKTGKLTVCGLRRFMTASGETCGAGHGGAPKRAMNRHEIATWIRRFEDGDLGTDEMPAELPELRAGDGRGKHAGFGAAMKGMQEMLTTAPPDDGLCPEIGGPHNYQHIDQQDDDSPLYCVDCDHRPDYNMKVAPTGNPVIGLTNDEVCRGMAVTLIGGGPPMTILTAPQSGLDRTVECVWFNRNWDLCRETFHLGTLRLARLRTER